MLVQGCPRNPRKLKRIINLIRFLSASTEDSAFEKYFPFIVIWSIITSAYPELSKIIKDNPNNLVQIAMIAYHIQDMDTLESRIGSIQSEGVITRVLQTSSIGRGMMIMLIQQKATGSLQKQYITSYKL